MNEEAGIRDTNGGPSTAPSGYALELRMASRINDLLRAMEEIAEASDFVFDLRERAQSALVQFDSGQSSGMITRAQFERIAKALVQPTWREKLVSNVNR